MWNPLLRPSMDTLLCCLPKDMVYTIIFLFCDLGAGRAVTDSERMIATVVYILFILVNLKGPGEALSLKTGENIRTFWAQKP